MADANAADAAVQAIINAANAAANAANAAQAAGAIPQAPAPFALWPGMANANPLDFNNPSDLKTFNKAIAPLQTQFDLKSENLKVFLECVKERARIYHWHDILQIPDDNAIDRNILTAYGLLSLANCRVHAATYVNLPTKNAQNSIMLYQFLSNTLTTEAKNKIQINAALYHIGGNEIPSGTCFLKIIIGKSTNDTISTVHVLRHSISNLENKMHEFKSDISAFNLYAQHLRNSLLARGHDVEDDLLMNLFRAYSVANDEHFVLYIEQRQNLYEDGAVTLVDELMESALNKYQLRIEKGIWNAMGRKDEQILALQAQLEGKVKTPKGPPTPRKGKDVFAWKKVKPTSGEAKTKTVDGKKYHWCIKHQAWTIHAPENCYMNTKKLTGTLAEPNGEKESPTDHEPSLTMSTALKAIADGESEWEDDESSQDA
jgi:hypothetical protein